MRNKKSFSSTWWLKSAVQRKVIVSVKKKTLKHTAACANCVCIYIFIKKKNTFRFSIYFECIQYFGIWNTSTQAECNPLNRCWIFTWHTSESILLLVCCIFLCLFCRFVQYQVLKGRLGLGHITGNIWTIKLWIQWGQGTTEISGCPNICYHCCLCWGGIFSLWSLALVA